MSTEEDSLPNQTKESINSNIVTESNVDANNSERNASIGKHADSNSNNSVSISAEATPHQLIGPLKLTPEYRLLAEIDEYCFLTPRARELEKELMTFQYDANADSIDDSQAAYVRLRELADEYQTDLNTEIIHHPRLKQVYQANPQASTRRVMEYYLKYNDDPYVKSLYQNFCKDSDLTPEEQKSDYKRLLWKTGGSYGMWLAFVTFVIYFFNVGSDMGKLLILWFMQVGVSGLVVLFGMGIQQIRKGNMEWKRRVFILGTMVLFYFVAMLFQSAVLLVALYVFACYIISMIIYGGLIAHVWIRKQRAKAGNSLHQ
ncbi:MFS transporter [Brevibacillus dissolubilis]|uniref:MFS transporter n=1 Tax=Brevibacillus dissolubilis TaxID=1844116 RepID=UPI0011169C0D|nr:MFS transporter [Brevibacillus dissolubilis]